MFCQLAIRRASGQSKARGCLLPEAAAWHRSVAGFWPCPEHPRYHWSGSPGCFLPVPVRPALSARPISRSRRSTILIRVFFPFSGVHGQIWILIWTVELERRVDEERLITILFDVSNGFIVKIVSDQTPLRSNRCPSLYRSCSPVRSS